MGYDKMFLGMTAFWCAIYEGRLRAIGFGNLRMATVNFWCQFLTFTVFNKYKDKDGSLFLIWVIFHVREVLDLGEMADVNFCRSALSCQCQTSCKFSSFQNRQKINNCSTIWYGSWLKRDVYVTRSQNQRLADFMKCARSVQFAILPSISQISHEWMTMN